VMNSRLPSEDMIASITLHLSVMSQSVWSCSPVSPGVCLAPHAEQLTAPAGQHSQATSRFAHSASYKSCSASAAYMVAAAMAAAAATPSRSKCFGFISSRVELCVKPAAFSRCKSDCPPFSVARPSSCNIQCKKGSSTRTRLLSNLSKSKRQFQNRHVSPDSTPIDMEVVICQIEVRLRHVQADWC